MRTIIKNNKKYAVIANETDLLDFSYIVASGVTTVNAILTADIDLNPGLDPKKPEDRNNCRIWVPIGITIGEKRSYSYEGEFLGNGHKISGIYTGNFICDEENQDRLYHIAQPTSNQHTRAYSMFGLFAQLGKNAQIKRNLTFSPPLNELNFLYKISASTSIKFSSLNILHSSKLGIMLYAISSVITSSF